ncbi:glycosyltransferase family 4 protein [Corynebacterium sp. TAE3-ERU12]|uniref:glycosyltransferase family 4 protein n=1 Tax=Corynebacterium sp. TAE3-ERU12 TaxID=2849491 RepID=UPI001C44228B|nr:glycosyltransferase family 4 protein [Corynebacterium sp. TAE3-ERU12]MBV7296248.1 glycosyltransferase family 4 protein [Corynebacterium sp. TAE3-ERU12]
MSQPASHPRVLLITNDFPPRAGGIESYLRDFCAQLPPESLTVLASTRAPQHDIDTHDAAAPYEIVRLRDRVLLPLPHVARAAARIIAERKIDVVWFGAAAPLALLGPACRRAGAKRIVATTHGHEVGWSMIPGARLALRRIGRSADAITYISNYTRRRFESAFGTSCQYFWMPSAVDATFFHPDAAAAARIRQRHDIAADTPVIACISRLVTRKGQDMLIRALPELIGDYPAVQLLIVGVGPKEKALRQLAERFGVLGHVIFTGRVDYADLPGYYAAANIFAMPARTRGAGLDVEGLGIVYLEAQACAVPVIAGDSGGAPETIIDGSTGMVCPGGDYHAIGRAISGLLADTDRAVAMGQAGRRHVEQNWTWSAMGEQLRAVLAGTAAPN